MPTTRPQNAAGPGEDALECRPTRTPGSSPLLHAFLAAFDEADEDLRRALARRIRPT